MHVSILIPNISDHKLLFCFCRAENAARKNTGEEPLPEEDPTNPVFKPIPEPSRLDSFLITNQIANYCNQINGYSIKLLEFGFKFALVVFPTLIYLLY